MEKEPDKKHRKRTKRLLNSIQKQLEFYFSDANLRHDNFLRKEITESSDEFVPLSTLLTFNKLKELCTETTMLAKAAENSEILQLNEAREKVKRLLPVPKIQNTDKQTVYVEQLHAYHDHDYLKEVFSSCGTVEYISLPRHKHNNQIKGFAFIEFSHPSEAEKACRLLHTPSSGKTKTKKRHSLSTEKATEAETDEETLQSKRKRRRSVSFSESSDLDSKKKQNISNMKRRRSVSECSDESPVKVKKKRKSSSDDKNTVLTTLSELKAKAAKEDILEKINTNQNDDDKDDESDQLKKTKKNKKRKQSDTSDNESSEKSKKRKHLKNESENDKMVTKVISGEKKEKEEEEEASDNESNSKKKKKRNRKHAKKNKEVNEIVVPPLYVIPKSEWLSMKKQYKSLQRTEIGKLKKQMRVLKSEKVRRKEVKDRIEETLESKKQTNSVKESKEEGHHQLLMQKGTVVFLETSSEHLKRQDIKEKLSQYTEVAYVDYIDGCPSGHVRLKNVEMLERLFEVDKSVRKQWEFRVKRMKEQDEKEYLEKAAEDRRKKYQKNASKNDRRNIRGKEKILRDVDKIME